MNTNTEPTMTAKPVAIATIESDDGYPQFEQLIRDRIAAATGPLFVVNVPDGVLTRAYLTNLPYNNAHYNCGCCKAFIERYGKLVTVDDTGYQRSLLWDDYMRAPEFFRRAVGEMDAAVSTSPITGVFLSSDKVWGVPVTGTWTHICGQPTIPAFKHPTLTAGQAMADKKQDYIILNQALRDYPKTVAAEAVRVLESDSLYRSEKAEGVAKWFFNLHQQIENVKGPRRSNLIWKAVATAPPGFCHVRSTMISTLLDDIAAGLDFQTISRRWASKMHPLQYQRPTAPPSVGVVKQAEELFEKMGAAPALRRRTATLDDVLSKLWTPKPQQQRPPSSQGLFGHLLPTQPGVKPVELPEKLITVEKFLRDVLPAAEQIDIAVPGRGAFFGLVTAVDKDAVPLLQWDGLDGCERNPTNHYFYNGGSTCNDWSLTPGWAAVTAVFFNSSKWQRPEQFTHHSDVLMFAVTGAVDKRIKGAGLALFPEVLRSELHTVRRVIEAYSQKGQIEGDGGNANGLAFSRNQSNPLAVRVRAATGVATYKIDRWD